MGEYSNILSFNTKYPSVSDLREKAQKRIPRFAFEYLEGGCNDEINLERNITDLQNVELMPQYLQAHKHAEISTQLFGEHYDAPFGIAPIGLQSLMWPGSAEILARAAFRHNIPFILSTVSTSSIEKISEITEGKAWFQLYYPSEEQVRLDIIDRAEAAGCQVLVVLADVPTFGFRPKDIKNGLAMPPDMTIKKILQILGKPTWAIQTLRKGRPRFETLLPYMPKGLDMKNLGQHMDKMFDGRLTEDRIGPIRDKWKGKLIIKGVVSEQDTERAINMGVDGIIVSNHGGRQLDAGQSTIKPLINLAPKFGDKITIMMDGGIRSGPDVARSLACGSKFTFMGRPFMYGVGALGAKGGDQAISILKVQLIQIMEQLACEKVEDLPGHLIKSSTS